MVQTKCRTLPVLQCSFKHREFSRNVHQIKSNKYKSTAPAIMRIIYNYFPLKMKTSTNT
jgi:hypothetical protein